MEFISHRPPPRRPIKISNLKEQRNFKYVPRFVDFYGKPLVVKPEFSGFPLKYKPVTENAVATIKVPVLGRSPITFERMYLWTQYSLHYDNRSTDDPPVGK